MVARCFALALLCLSFAQAYVLPAARPVAVRRASSPSMMLSPTDFPAAMTLLAEIVDEEGERIYGAVEAPGWVLPVGGLLAILTALLPVLLAPGDEAFKRQQGDEAEVSKLNRGQKFGTGRRD